MDSRVRRSIRGRAADRCEYCRLPQDAVEITFHVEHVIARQHGGTDSLENLALACDRCNLHKGPNLTAIDPASGAVVHLFNPRRDAWDDHFWFDAAVIEGLTPTGRATARLLEMNSPRRVALRASLQEF